MSLHGLPGPGSLASGTAHGDVVSSGPGSVAVVFGTRPEIVKLAPVLHELGGLGYGVFTGQHYDADLTDAFFESSRLDPPAVHLEGIGGKDRARQVHLMIGQLIEVFEERRPGAVVVQGDTNSANAAAQAAHYCGVPVVHVEAGLRSYDREMPEEINRLVIGAVADVHCAATPRNARALLDAGAPAESVHVTGNTIVEATLAALPDHADRIDRLDEYGVEPGRYVLSTLHRPENADDPRKLAEILDQLGALGLPVLLPLHPRTRRRIDVERIVLPRTVTALPPADHPTFLSLAAEARLVVSDSGGVQEEVTVLRKPLVVVRNSTERPESVEAGFSILTGPAGIADAARDLLQPARLNQLAMTPSPYGDGLASHRIAVLTARAAGVELPPTLRSTHAALAFDPLHSLTEAS